MHRFLKESTRKIVENFDDLSRIVLITPNKRTGLFIKNEFAQRLNIPTFLPEILTFDRWVEQLTQLQKISTTELSFEFYKVYKSIHSTETFEPFETFTLWSTTVLNDFNAIDKNLVSPKSIFDTLKGINQIYNWEWGTETELTKQYKLFLQRLDVYYQKLTQQLLNQKKSYQGLIFREAVHELPLFIQNTDVHLVFIGLQNLSIAEQTIIDELLQAGRATVYQETVTDFDYFYTQNNTISPISETPEIEIIGVHKKTGIAKYIGQCLYNNNLPENTTAIVLADDKMLLPVLHAIPENINQINITLGTKLYYFPIISVFDILFKLNKEFITNNGNIYYKTWFELLQHPSFQSTDTCFTDIIQQIISTNKVYFDVEEFKTYLSDCKSSQEIMNSISAVIVQQKPNEFIEKLILLLNDFKKLTAASDTEILFKIYQFCQQLLIWLQEFDFLDQLTTLHHIFRQFFQNERFHFTGQPLQGLQIMGFLEAQLLSFEHVIVAGANVGKLPSEQKTESFIPYDVRIYYQLPTHRDIERQYAHTFYHLIENSKKITLLYNTDVEPLGGGEKSIFIEQLLYKYPDLKQQIIHIENATAGIYPQEIKKTSEIIQKLKDIFQKGISPSALAAYIYNPIEFYKQRLLHLDQENEMEENMAENTLGNVVHEVLENLYKPFENQYLEETDLQNIFAKIDNFTLSAFDKNYPNGNLTEGKNRLMVEVAKNYIKRFVKQEITQIKLGNQIKIIALEQPVNAVLTLENIDFPVTFIGKIDRIDLYNKQIRIIDYKTGKVMAANLRINNFDQKISNPVYSKALQVLLYATIYSKQNNLTDDLQAGIISFKNHKAGFLPLNFADRNTDYTITSERREEFLQNISRLIQEILNPDINFIEKSV